MSDCDHSEYEFNGTVLSGFESRTVKQLSLSCKQCGARYEWLPFMATEKDTGDLLLSARIVSEPHLLSITQPAPRSEA